MPTEGRPPMTEKTSTFLGGAINSALDESQGRFAKSPPTITGAGMKYPRLPEDHPSNQHSKVPDEPPFPTDINFVPPCGEAHEVRPAERSPSSLSSLVTEDQVQDAPVAFPAVERPAPSQDEIDDGCPGPRRADGTPMSTSLPVRRRA